MSLTEILYTYVRLMAMTWHHVLHSVAVDIKPVLYVSVAHMCVLCAPSACSLFFHCSGSHVCRFSFLTHMFSVIVVHMLVVEIYLFVGDTCFSRVCALVWGGCYLNVCDFLLLRWGVCC